MRVYSYDSVERHCREGYAIERDSGHLFDTFWRSGQDAHGLTVSEVATRVFVFDTDDYDELDEHQKSSRHEWEKYAPKDRETITSQHGLTVRYFVRRDASPDLGTQIDNAISDLIDAEASVRGAKIRRQWAKKVLADLRDDQR